MGRFSYLLVGVLVLSGCASNADQPAAQTHSDSTTTTAADIDTAALADELALAREGTGQYVTDLDRAVADGYQVITPMMEDMGVHYLNPTITEFDPAKPHILVYVPTNAGPQLGALEWVFPEVPAQEPFPGAQYGEFPAACHYVDGTFIPTEAEADCAETGAGGAAFSFWHPLLKTLHVWLWFDNPDGIFTGMNPLVSPFNSAAGIMDLNYGT